MDKKGNFVMESKHPSNIQALLRISVSLPQNSIDSVNDFSQFPMSILVLLSPQRRNFKDFIANLPAPNCMSIAYCSHHSARNLLIGINGWFPHLRHTQECVLPLLKLEGVAEVVESFAKWAL